MVAQRLTEWMAQRIDLDTQVKVAERSGIGQSSVQRILNGEVNPTLSVLDQIASAFGKEAAELICQPDESSINYDRPAYKALPEYEKVRVEAFIKHAITQYSSTQYAGEAQPAPKAHRPATAVVNEPSAFKRVKRPAKAALKTTVRKHRSA